MFMEEIAPDVIVEVSGRRIKAHKCILSSRYAFYIDLIVVRLELLFHNSIEYLNISFNCQKTVPLCFKSYIMYNGNCNCW